jgi:hypothetical protein
VIRDASPQDLIPDASFLPPSAEWNAIPQEKLSEFNNQTRKPLSNGNLSPGVQTYRDRQKELQIDNKSAFRTIRRIPVPAGETAARLGNSYEFYKNLEFFSGYWPDTSLPTEPEASSSPEQEKEAVPHHLQTHVRTGTGAQMPPDYRQNLLSAFIKLVAYDFGCNVSFPRCEPRLHLTPAPNSSTTRPPSYFNSSAMFIYRTPIDRASARAGVVEGPVAALSSRASVVFATEAEEYLDLAREVVASLLTAQQRAREVKREQRFGEGKWWTSTPRWGGGPGGPIGKEVDRLEEAAAAAAAAAAKATTRPPDITSTPSSSSSSTSVPTSSPGAGAKPPIEPAATESRVVTESKRQIHSITGPSPASSSISTKRTRKGSKDTSNLPMYENYRKMYPPGPTWDRKARYKAIGKVPGAGYDDVFLVSALNHHVSIVRTRVPMGLLEHLDGLGEREWGRVEMWRSRWFDFFLKEDRLEAMDLVWGMMGWLMRKIEAPQAELKVESAPVSEAVIMTGTGEAEATGSGEGSAATSNAIPASAAAEDQGEKMDLS